MRHRLTIDWAALERTHEVSRCCWWWVTDESIAIALRDGLRDDLNSPWTAATHQAARIASLVRLFDAGQLTGALRVDLHGRKAHLRDGHHRLRTYQFRQALHAVPVEIALL